MALNYVTITGTFDDGSGAPLNGTVTFTPTQTVYSSGVPLVSTAKPIVAQVINGSLKSPAGGTLQLLATDNTGLTFEGLTGFFNWNVLDGISGNSWQFSLPHTPSTVDLYSLANTPSGGGALPLTTLGDTVYENATPAPARLAGNTSATKNFLTQTGTGSVSAAPAWGTIAVTDIPSLTTTFTFGSTGAAPSSGTYTTGQVLVDQNGVERVCTAGGTSGTWARVGDQPHQFRPEDYGAKGNGKVVADVVTNGTTTITSASAAFTAADVGKYVMIHGANGTTSGPLLTTIASFTNATTVVLTAAAGASVSNCPMVYGTDDVTAINNCITAASSYAQGATGSFMCEILFGARIYTLGTGPTQSGNGNTTVTTNTQIPIPYPAAAGTTQKLIFKMTGVGAGYTQYWQSTTPQIAGTALVSILPTQPNNSPSGSTGQQSVVGGPAYATTSVNPGFPSSAGGPGFANVKVLISGINIWLNMFTNIIAWDLSGVAQAYAFNSGAHIFAPTGVNTGAVQPYLNSLPSNATFKSNVSTGFTSPFVQNNADLVWGDCSVMGYECGFRVYDHFHADSLRAIYCDVALNVDRQGAAPSHLISIGNMDAESYNGGLQGPQGQMSHVNIWWSAECGSVVYDVRDTASNLFGEFHFQDSADTSRSITVTNCAALHIVNDELGPGHMASPPSVPLTTVAAALVFRDAWVSVHTGAGVTVSAITIDGTATGLTMVASSSVAVRVPTGKTIALTYSGGTPTWDWWLD